MTIVTFNACISPYMKGDTVELGGAEKRRVDEIAARRGLKDAYTPLEKSLVRKQTKKAPAKRRKTSKK